ncbi:MAG TPA: PSD1 and planctomycete cytochrome C domain-containing protein [Tepidisphaeraceae bacterium]|nr:PSD1 and planctomycete cytochrome C domain-containing protein [Tepidisphaeraceae bacterium]
MAVLSAHAQAANSDLFETKIRPLLAENCYSCHSAQAKSLKGGLRLDSKQGVLDGGKGGPVLVPGDPDHSKIIEAVGWSNHKLRMPPKKRLSRQQVADLAAWIKIGAPDPRLDSPTGPAPTVAGPAIDFAVARKQWAYHAPQPHPIPAVKDAGWCQSPIDHFILAKLEEKGLRPAPRADKRALVRRAYFDLIGLPPTPGEVDAFVKNTSPDAFAKVVDDLLARPQYGERWGRHWLDVVRYTDSFDSRGVGSAGDCAEAWRYRDWVVKSFNQDLPYDQFVMQQVAGDLLPGKDGKFNADGLVATGMYVIGNWPGGDADRKKMMTDIVDDQVDVTGRAFLGLTIACARCHDHKFDPIAQADYYGLAGIFFSSHFLPDPGSPTSGGPLLRFPIATPAEVERHKKFDEQVASLNKGIEQFRDEAIVAHARELLPGTDKYLAAALEIHAQPANKQPATFTALVNSRKLDGIALSRWNAYLAPYFKPDVTRTLLATPRHNVAGIAGVDGWTGPTDQPPSLTANATDRPIPIGTLTLPPKSVCVHPGPRSGVAVGWRSPISGTVRVSGRVIDADASCGNGIDWAIEHIAGQVPSRLASGSFPNGGRQEFSAGSGADHLNAIEVKAGDFLQMIVYPKGDYSCDTTVVELRITERDGAKRRWDLTRDLLPNVLADGKGNPHADSLGNAGVWHFYEVPDESPANSAPPDSALAKWAAAARALAGNKTARDANVSAAATAVRDALVALEQKAKALRDTKGALASLAGPDAGLYRDLTSPAGPFWGAVRSQDETLSGSARQHLASMKQELALLQKTGPPPIPVCEALTEGGVPQSIYEGIHDTRIHFRGRYDRLGATVPRHMPTLLAGDHQPPITQGSGRLQLAKWLASPQNPQTARVMVNRLWEHHFGEGIVRTPNNYGKLGVPPTHPELLDWLALEFIHRGWSIKTMQREIMLSAAYQQSAIPDPQTLKADPDDLLFGWQRRRRLEAEAIRDSLLAGAGTLDLTVGGPSIRDMNTHRRTLYLMTIRSERSDYRTLFDAADPTAIVDQRNNSTVAPQALFLLNSPFVVEQTRLLSQRVLKQGPAEDREKIKWLYRRLYAREASDKEIDVGLDLLKEAQRAESAGGPLSRDAAWEAYCQVSVCANEFVYVD